MYVKSLSNIQSKPFLTKGCIKISKFITILWEWLHFVHDVTLYVAHLQLSGSLTSRIAIKMWNKCLYYGHYSCHKMSLEIWLL